METTVLELKVEALLQSNRYLESAIKLAPDEKDKVRLGELLSAYEDQLALIDALLQTQKRWSDS